MTEATGWRWVPEEPTEEMVEEGWFTWWGHSCHGAHPDRRETDTCWSTNARCHCRIAFEGAVPAYRAMLAAAPYAPEPSELISRLDWALKTWVFEGDERDLLADCRAALSASAPPADELVAVAEEYRRAVGFRDAATASGNEPEVDRAIERFIEADQALSKALARHRAQPSDCTAEEMRERAAQWHEERAAEYDAEVKTRKRHGRAATVLGLNAMAHREYAAAIRNLSAKE